jgi:hypothetical protein
MNDREFGEMPGHESLSIICFHKMVTMPQQIRQYFRRRLSVCDITAQCMFGRRHDILAFSRQ